MIEQKLEKIIVEKIQAAFLSAEIPDVQIIGAWQPDTDGPKAKEETDAEAILAVNVSPRLYETPTIPDAQFNVSLALAVRAECDQGGTDWLHITEAVSGILQTWQKGFNAYATDFAIEGEFVPTGF